MKYRITFGQTRYFQAQVIFEEDDPELVEDAAQEILAAENPVFDDVTRSADGDLEILEIEQEDAPGEWRTIGGTDGVPLTDTEGEDQ